MPPRQSRPPTVSSLLPPILSLLEPPSPNPYSAHQKALTTTARIASSHPDVATEILFSTARELLKLGEAGSGSELGVRMVQILEQADRDVDEKSRASVTQLLALTPAHGPWRKKLADAAIRWTSTHGECPTGDPSLHQYVGELYYKGECRVRSAEVFSTYPTRFQTLPRVSYPRAQLLVLVLKWDHDFILAEQHLLAAGKRDAAKLLAEMMFEWCEKGKLDPGPYAVRGTLPFLSYRPPNILPALTFLTNFLSLLSSSPSAKHLFTTTLPSQTSFSITDIQLTTSPTLNFLQLALITIQRAPGEGVSGVAARGLDGGVAKEWEALVGRYRRISGVNGVLGQKEVQEVLQQISTNVFLIPPPRGQSDMLQNLMGSLFGGGR